MGLGVDAMKHIVLNGFKASFLPFHEKQDLMRSVAKELARFGDDGSIGPRQPTEAGELAAEGGAEDATA